VSRPALSLPSLIQLVPVARSTVVRQPEREVKYLSQFNAKVCNPQSFTSMPLNVFISRCLVTKVIQYVCAGRVIYLFRLCMFTGIVALAMPSE
jgi:hypothetical protein